MLSDTELHFDCPDSNYVDARDLIANILTQDPTKRLTIPQILNHAWFGAAPHTSKSQSMADDAISLSSDRPDSPSPASRKPESPLPPLPKTANSPLPPLPTSPEPSSSSSAEHSNASDATNLSSEFVTTAPTTPDLDDPFDQGYVLEKYRHPNTSQTTIKKTSDNSDGPRTMKPPETVVEEEDPELTPAPNRSNLRAPPVHTLRTPARTKRRSVSSTLSDPDAPGEDITPTLPIPQASRDVDFANLLSTPTPIIFSTPSERKLLNSLSDIGYDTGQIVYSVLNDACDASGAVWWMLLRKGERKALEEAADPSISRSESPARRRRADHRTAGTQTEAGQGMTLDVSSSKTPQLSFVPPTPTAPAGARPMTPPVRAGSPGYSLLTPSSSLIMEATKSNPTTPTGSHKAGRKARSGSVSIMQRATTALEAAGLVRKKSAEGIKDQQQKDEKKEKAKEEKRESKTKADEPRSSHGSHSSRLTKSPPLRATPAPTTPPPNELHHEMDPSSPWVMTERGELVRSLTAPTPVNSPGELINTGPAYATVGKTNNRHRGNFLNTFRFWLNEEKKNKRKESVQTPVKYGSNRSPAGQAFKPSSVKRNSGGGGTRGRRRGHRPSISSRRSSSVNSRRSSISNQHIMVDSPQMQGRPSFGSHTPNAESEGYPSRPSSIHSFSQHHRKSPSAGSINSQHYRTASPMQKYHRRGGSGSSTRVRQTQRATHGRSNSAASSMHSPVSSRPTSFIEFSENEGVGRTSPLRQRRSSDESRHRGNFTFAAHKKGAGFSSPYTGSVSRSSWKKSWGLEPPGWQTRTAHLPVEVLSISPAVEGTSVRDVFASKNGITSAGDDSDWVDEDDDIPYAGGLGQLTFPSSSSKGLTLKIDPPPTAMTPPPRASSHKRANNKAEGSSSSSSSSGTRHKRSDSHSPVRSAPSANETDTSRSRRHLPPGRGKGAAPTITEEEEEEEEE